MNSVQKVIKYFAMGFALLLTVGIITAIAGVVLSVADGQYIDGSEADVISYTREFEDVKSLDINYGEVNVEIKTGDSFRVEATNVPEDYEAKLTNNGTLQIGNGEDHQWFFLNIHIFDNVKKGKYLITVPVDFVAEELRIHGSGNLSMEGINAKKLVLDTGSGSLKATRLVADKAKVDGGSGDLYFEKVTISDFQLDSGSGAVTMVESELSNMDLDSGSGAVNISGILQGDTKIESGSGNVSLQIDAHEDDYELDCDTGSGGIWISGEKVGNEYHSYNKSSRNRIKVDGGSGRISIDFNLK